MKQKKQIKNTDIVQLVEDGRIPIKVLVRKLPLSTDIYIGRFNGWSWVVRNPVLFNSVKEAQDEIDRLCKANPKYINQKDF